MNINKKLATQLINALQLRKAKKLAMGTLLSASLMLPQFANAFVVNSKTSIDPLDKTTSLFYTAMLVVAGLMIVAVGVGCAWVIITGPGDGIMKLFIKMGAAGVILAIAFWIAPGFYNFCI